LCSFISYVYGHPLYLHSFPTRRSSDLEVVSVAPDVLQQVAVRVGDTVGPAGRPGLVKDVGEIARRDRHARVGVVQPGVQLVQIRSEEHTSELQSRGHLVCRLLLEKKKK